MSNHPATYPNNVLTAIEDALGHASLVLDPFAGTGRIHELATKDRKTLGYEIEPEWAALHPHTICGDSRNMALIPDASIDVVATSPAYGNRMSDSYAGDGTPRYTYRVALGRPLTDGSGAALQWGAEYRTVHEAVWRECWRVLRPEGRLLLNCKDHIRHGKRQFVTAWHVACLKRIGFVYAGRRRIPTPGQRHGANGDLRLDWEVLVALEKPWLAPS